MSVTAPQGFRAAGIAADRSFDGRSMRAQFKAADRSQARVALVVGEQEAASATVTLRDLRDGAQRVVDRRDVLKHVQELLA